VGERRKKGVINLKRYLSREKSGRKFQQTMIWFFDGCFYKWVVYGEKKGLSLGKAFSMVGFLIFTVTE